MKQDWALRLKLAFQFMVIYMTDTFDILGIMESAALAEANGWIEILPGDDERRPPWLKKVARTVVELTLNTEKDLEMFLDEIKKSSDKLSLVPDDLLMYTWELVRRKELSIRFVVAWYDLDFYEARKDAFKSDQHSKIFEKFNVTASDLTVTHATF